MAKRKSRKKAESVFVMKVNTHTLSGEKRDGRWTFTCPSFPDLDERYSGFETTDKVIDEFVKRSLGVAQTVIQRLKGE